MKGDVQNATLYVGSVILLTVAMSVCFWDTLATNDFSAVVRNVALVAAAVIAIPLAVWRSIVASRQYEGMEKQIEGIERQVSVSQSGAVGAQLLKAAEMLGNEKEAVIMGGVYTLGHIGEDHPEEYGKQVESILSAFALREIPEGLPLPEPGEHDKYRYPGSAEGAMAWRYYRRISKRLADAGTT